MNLSMIIIIIIIIIIIPICYTVHDTPSWLNFNDLHTNVAKYTLDGLEHHFDRLITILKYKQIQISPHLNSWISSSQFVQIAQEISNRTHVSRTPKPVYLITRSQLTWSGVRFDDVPFSEVGYVPFPKVAYVSFVGISSPRNVDTSKLKLFLFQNPCHTIPQFYDIAPF